MSDNTDKQVKMNEHRNKKPNLDELLDSALEDFADTQGDSEEKPSPVFNREENLRQKSQENNDLSARDNRNLLFGDSDVESVLNSILNSDGRDDSSESIDEVIAETMEKLSKSSEGIENDLSEMLKNVDLNDESTLFPFVEGALQTFLCKDILYPSMNSIKNRYPDWIDENKSKISETDYNRYIKQYGFIQQICTEFEKEKDDDTEQMKKEHFQKLLELMQKVNECGDPPSELVGDQLYNPIGMNSLNMTDNNGLNQCPIS